MDYFLWTVAILAVLAGLVGTVIPAIPGSLLVFGGMVAGASVDGFERVGFWTLAALLFLTVLSYVAEMLATAYGARKTGAGKWALVGAFAGSVVGMFFGIIGIIVGPFIGAVAGEYLVNQDLKKAGIAGTGAWLGIILGSAAKAALALMMVGIFLLAYFY